MAGQRQFDRGISVLIFPPQDLAADEPTPPIDINRLPPVTGVPAAPQVHVQFSITKTLTPEPNTATIRLFNLSKSTRDAITGTVRKVVDWLPPEPVVLVDGLLKPGGNIVTSQLGGMAGVTLLAGYGGALGAVFNGTATRVRSRRQGVDRVTEIQVTDGGFQASVAVANKTFLPGTPAGVVVAYLAQVLGMGLAPTAGLTALSGFTLVGGLVASGDPVRGIGDLADALDLTWWFEDGLVYILADLESLPSQPIVITTEEIPGAVRLRSEPDPADSGALRLECLFAPEIRPGYQIALVAGDFRGTFRVEQVTHEGGNRQGVMRTTALVRDQSPLGL